MLSGKVTSHGEDARRLNKPPPTTFCSDNCGQVLCVSYQEITTTAGCVITVNQDIVRRRARDAIAAPTAPKRASAQLPGSGTLLLRFRPESNRIDDSMEFPNGS